MIPQSFHSSLRLQRLAPLPSIASICLLSFRSQLSFPHGLDREWFCYLRRCHQWFCAVELSTRDQAGISCFPMVFHSVVFPAFAVLQVSIVFLFSRVSHLG